MIKKKITILVLNSVIFSFGQECCETLKKDLNSVKADIQAVKNENLALKKAIEINTPILKAEKENTEFNVTKVIGNKKDKTITITFLVESKDENKKSSIQDISIVDIEGNEYEVDFYKSSRPFPELSKNVPLKLTFTLKDIKNESLYVKILRFRVNTNSNYNPFEEKKFSIELRDFKVEWQ